MAVETRWSAETGFEPPLPERPATKAERVRRSDRIAIVGCPGSGKSTLTRALEAKGAPGRALRPASLRAGLGRALGALRSCRSGELARLHSAAGSGRPHGRGYRSFSRCRRKAKDLAGQFESTVTARERSGASKMGSTWAGGTVPRRMCMHRVIKRVAQNWGEVRPDMASGCPERVDVAFFRFVRRWSELSRPENLERLSALPIPMFWDRHP